MAERPVPTRVLQVVTRLNVGGPARHLAGLVSSLGPDYVTVIAAGRAPDSEGQLSVPGVRTVTVPLVRRPSPRHDLAAARQLRRLIDRGRPDVVATHTTKAGVLGRVAARRAAHRAVTVHTYHGHLLEGYFAPSVIRAIVASERALARQTDALVAVSAEVRDALLGEGIGRAEQWHVVPIAVDLEPFAAGELPSGVLRAWLGLGSEVPLIGAVGRLAAVKDLDLLLCAVARLPGVHLALVGDGPARGHLEALAVELGIAGRVRVTGWWSEVEQVYADLDAVVLSSRNEGTPSALLEAAVAGRPIVATAVGGVPGIFDHGVSALLVAAGDVAGFAAAVQVVLNDAQAAGERARRAREVVLGRFGTRRSVARHHRLFDALLTAR